VLWKAQGKKHLPQLPNQSKNHFLPSMNENLPSKNAGKRRLLKEKTKQNVCVSPYEQMSWLGQIRPHRRDESWSTSLWQTFFSTSMGAQIPVITEKPLATCGCRKFQLDPLGDHLNTCVPPTRVPKRHTTGWLINLLTFFAQRIRLKHRRWLKAEVNIVETLSYRV
jgi:hypothetical protein